MKHAFDDLVVLCPLRYGFSLTIHVVLDSLNTEKNETEEMHSGISSLCLPWSRAINLTTCRFSSPARTLSNLYIQPPSVTSNQQFFYLSSSKPPSSSQSGWWEIKNYSKIACIMWTTCFLQRSKTVTSAYMVVSRVCYQWNIHNNTKPHEMKLAYQQKPSQYAGTNKTWNVSWQSQQDF